MVPVLLFWENNMKDTRPVYLNLLQLRFPVTAIASILHRISGVIVFLLIPLMLWTLGESLRSPQSFQSLIGHLGHPVLKFFMWVFLGGLLFHLVSGIRHLLMDIGLGDSYSVGRISAYISIIMGAVLIVLAGIWLW